MNPPTIVKNSSKKTKKQEEENYTDIIDENFVVFKPFSQGSYGVIYHCISLRDSAELAVKKEEKSITSFSSNKNILKNSQLYTEAKIYKTLLKIYEKELSGKVKIPQEKILGVPKFYGMGETDEYYYLIIELLGPNLNELYRFCKNKFSITSICLIALQIINRLEYLHANNYIHRDIKPENFIIGNKKTSNIIYLIDFGLSKKYKYIKNGQHIPYKEGKKYLIGTARYASVNAHNGIELSRRDDLESLSYLLIYLSKGNLPWIGVKNDKENNINKYQKINEIKCKISTEVLCYGLPDEFGEFLNYCKRLKFEDKPNYDYLRNLFLRCLINAYDMYNLNEKFLNFDWTFKHNENLLEKYKNNDDISKNKKYQKLITNIINNKDKNDNNNNNNQEIIDNSNFLSITFSQSNKNNPDLSKSTQSIDEDDNDEVGSKTKNIYSISGDSISENKKNEDKLSDEEDSSNDTIEHEFSPTEMGNRITEKQKSYIQNFRQTEKIDILINKIINKPSITNSNASTNHTENNCSSKISIDLINLKLKNIFYQNVLIYKNRKLQNNIEIIPHNKHFDKFSLNLPEDEKKKLINIYKQKIIDLKTNKNQSNPEKSKFNNFQNITKENSIKFPDVINKQIKLRRAINTLCKSQYLDNTGIENFTLSDVVGDINFARENLIKIKKEPLTNYYKIIKDLGHGSFGSVKLVEHIQLGEIRAMKIVSKKSKSSLNEIEILKIISHPNIINIYEIYEDSKKYYIMNEFLQGGELFESLTKLGKLNECIAAFVLKQIMNAINYLHSLNIVHRDLKPENIMIIDKNQLTLKIIDFGGGKILKPGVFENDIVGTPYYIAPEVLKKKYNEKCDIWSCGVILFILLGGYPPFNGKKREELFENILNKSVKFNQENWKSISDEAKDLIEKMLDKDFNSRPSAKQVLQHPWFKLYSEDSLKVVDIDNDNKRTINRIACFVKENKLKQAVLKFITVHFQLGKEEELLKKRFKQFDLDGNCLISQQEFKNVLINIYGEYNAELLTKKIFPLINVNGSGEISYNEFITALIDNRKIVTLDKLEKAFKLFDKDNSGKLSVKEIMYIFGGDEENWRKIIKEVVKDNEEEVDFEEFKTLMFGWNKEIGSTEIIDVN